LKKFSIGIVFVLALFFTSCRVKKKMVLPAKSEKKELQDLHVKKDLKKEIEKWLGTPYRYGGISKQGVDCSGFVNAIYKEVYEIKLPRSSKEIYNASKHIKMKDLEEGDLIFFNYSGKGVSHVGIYLSDNMYVHASSTNGVVISDLTNPYTKKNIVGAGRVR
jgi:cell wall-associated NlpC family hydrolase